ncbi:MAG TPA: DNA polymerase III subunit delta' [Anaerolineae bacterium]|nr:DNA polymerase III subunit delta' [Anaerolineae bacterium]
MSEWQNVIGHDWAVEMLAGGITHGRIGHAYLITGPDHLGKTTLARTFAQALNCEAEGERPCGRCRSCMLIAADHHPDVQLVQPEVSGRGKLTLKIEAIRELQRHLNLSAHEGRYKVAILKRFDAATTGAANAFLKTLEEPPENVVLLLTANDADTLLPTISSRCRTVNLRPSPPNLIEQSLTTRWRVPEDQAHLLAYLADGRIGWAVLAAEDKTILQARAAHLEYLHDALTGNRVSRFQLADKLARKPENLPQILQTWLSWWRDVNLLARQNGAPAALTNIDERPLLEETARATDEESALAALKQTNLALWQLERNANTRLALENLLLTYPYVMREA